MPAHKRSQETPEDDALINNHDQPENEVESDGNDSSSSEDEDECMFINLSGVLKELQCHICQGIIRKTRTVTECLHRFCGECIDKFMRLGNNECPACGAHCDGGQHSLRDDPNYDALIAAICPDIDKYVDKELALLEDAMTQNKQASLHSEGNKREKVDKVSNDNKDVNDKDGGKDSSSGDEQTEIEPRGRQEDGGERETQIPQHSTATDTEGVGDAEARRKDRLARLAEHLRNSDKDEDKLSVYLKIVPFDEQSMPSLERPYLSCEPTTSVKILRQYVALKTGLHEDEVELWLVINPDTNFILGERTIDPQEDELRVLGDQETLAELYTYHNANWAHLVMAYKEKLQNLDTAGSS